MTGTLITESNMYMFLPALGKEKIEDKDLIVGVIDEETETACGVLWAEAGDNNNLVIREVIVEKSYRDKGAGEELLRFFLEIADELSATNISFSYISSEDNEYLYNLFDGAGFADTSEELSEYVVRVMDLSDDGEEIDMPKVLIYAVRSLPDCFRDIFTSFDIDDCLGDISFVACNDDRELGGIIFDRFRDMLHLKFLDAYGDNRDKILYLLYNAAFRKLVKSYDPDTWILISLPSERAGEMLNILSVGDAIRYSEAVYFNLKR